MQSKGSGENVTLYVLSSSCPSFAEICILLLSLSFDVVSQLSLYGQLIKSGFLRGNVCESLCKLIEKRIRESHLLSQLSPTRVRRTAQICHSFSNSVTEKMKRNLAWISCMVIENSISISPRTDHPGVLIN